MDPTEQAAREEAIRSFLRGIEQSKVSGYPVDRMLHAAPGLLQSALALLDIERTEHAALGRRFDWQADEIMRAYQESGVTTAEIVSRRLSAIVRTLREERDTERTARLAAEGERDAHATTLYREGYTPCASPACNCGSWHGGHIAATPSARSRSASCSKPRTRPSAPWSRSSPDPTRRPVAGAATGDPMLIQVPVGRYSAPTHALIDTTTMAIEPDPFAPRVSQIDTARTWVQAWQSYATAETLETLATKNKVSVEEAQAIVDAARTEDLAEWRREALDRMDREYCNATVTTPSGRTISTHATVAEIRVAIFDAHAKGVPIATVMHRYDPLPEFDERGYPPEDGREVDGVPF